MNQIWKMAFVADARFDSPKLWTLTVVDHYIRLSLATDVGQGLIEEDVLTTLSCVAATRELIATMKVDDGSKFVSKGIEHWSYERGVGLDGSRHGETTNSKIKCFNGRLQQKEKKLILFLSVYDAK
jgi:putative transposase